MRTLLFCLVAISIISCQDNNGTADTTNDTTLSPSTEPGSPITSEQCFRKVLSRDTFSIKITQTGNAISGTLAFDNYEKDSSKGTVKGTTTGDTLKLWYDFQSEGMHSVMQVYFKKEGDKLIRGIGSMDVKGDTSYFSNPPDIKFGEKDAWNKVDCK
jgi:hypothetical protein